MHPTPMTVSAADSIIHLQHFRPLPVPLHLGQSLAPSSVSRVLLTFINLSYLLFSHTPHLDSSPMTIFLLCITSLPQIICLIVYIPPFVVIWENVAIPKSQVTMRTYITNFGLIIGTDSPAQVLASLYECQESIPQYSPLTPQSFFFVLLTMSYTKNKNLLPSIFPSLCSTPLSPGSVFWSTLVTWVNGFARIDFLPEDQQYYLSVVILLMFLLILPFIFDTLARNYEGMKLESEIQNAIMTRCYNDSVTHSLPPLMPV